MVRRRYRRTLKYGRSRNRSRKGTRSRRNLGKRSRRNLRNRSRRNRSRNRSRNRRMVGGMEQNPWNEGYRSYGLEPRDFDDVSDPTHPLFGFGKYSHGERLLRVQELRRNRADADAAADAAAAGPMPMAMAADADAGPMPMAAVEPTPMPMAAEGPMAADADAAGPMAAEGPMPMATEDEDPSNGPEDQVAIESQPEIGGESLPTHVYRALRPDELSTLVENNQLRPPCRCVPGPDEAAVANHCCDISAGAHINSGSRAVVKSRWISTTRVPGIAALWASTRPSIDGSVVRLDGNHSSGLFVSISTEGLELNDPLTFPDGEIGVTALNAAKASREILIKDQLPYHSVVGLHQAQQVTKPVYDAHPASHKIRGKRRKKDATILNVIWTDTLINTPDNFAAILQAAASRGLGGRFQ